MSNAERQAMRGRLTLVLRDARGHELERREVDNLITDAGRAFVARYFGGLLQGTPRLFIAVGTGKKPGAQETNKEAATDTALSNEVQRAEATVSAKGSVTTVTATLPAKGSGDVLPLEEAGIQIELSGQSTVVLYNRVTFAVVNKSPNMGMTLSWEVTF